MKRISRRNFLKVAGVGAAALGLAALREAGVTVLSNEFVPLERDGDAILIAGIDDPNGYADQKTPDGLAGEIYSAYDDPFWLLLAHRNNLFNGRYCRLGAPPGTAKAPVSKIVLTKFNFFNIGL